MTPIKQRKKPVQRLYNGLVGLPPEPESATAPPFEPIPVKSETTGFVDRTLVCDDCYQEFLFSAEDQGLFAENQLSPPRRCKSCEADAIQQVESPDIAVPPTVPSVPELLEHIEDAKAEKEAARQRARRKLKREQLAAIKEQLATPIAEVKRAAEERAKAEELPSMNAGRFMKKAPTGKGELVTGGYDPEQIESVAAARSRSVKLGSSTIDPETGEAYWPENDRGRVVPEGTGQRPGERDQQDDNPDATEDAQDNRTEDGRDADIFPGDKFLVRLNDAGREGAIRELAHEYVIETVHETAHGDENEPGCSLCRLCQTFIAESGVDHIEAAHGDESEPTHDARFGDIVDSYIKRQERKEAKLQKVGRHKAREVAADAKARSEAEAMRAGYVRLNGEWILKSRTG